MADSVSITEVDLPPPKTPKLDDKAIVKPKPTSIYDRLRLGDPETDEYVRQFLLFHYQFHKTEGFGIEWEKFDYYFDLCSPFDGTFRWSAKQSNQEVISEVTLRAIAIYNKENEKNLVFVEHVWANWEASGYAQYWITFWARDMSSHCPDSKLYQAKIMERGREFKVPIFRVKPTDQEAERAAALVRVKPPYPLRYDIDKPPVVFRFGGPGEDPVPGTPFVFSRDGVEVDIESSSEEDEGLYVVAASRTEKEKWGFILSGADKYEVSNKRSGFKYKERSSMDVGHRTLDNATAVSSRLLEGSLGNGRMQCMFTQWVIENTPNPSCS